MTEQLTTDVAAAASAAAAAAAVNDDNEEDEVNVDVIIMQSRGNYRSCNDTHTTIAVICIDQYDAPQRYRAVMIQLMHNVHSTSMQTLSC